MNRDRPNVRLLSTLGRFPEGFSETPKPLTLPFDGPGLTPLFARVVQPGAGAVCVARGIELDARANAEFVSLAPEILELGFPERALISNAGATEFRSALYTYNAFEPLRRETRVISPSGSSHLLSSANHVAGPLSFGWTGVIAGQFGADGLYSVVTKFTDACFNEVELRALTELDATPPTIIIDSPLQGAVVDAQAVMPLRGHIFDRNFSHWSVQNADGNVVLSGDRAINLGQLNQIGNLNLVGLSGVQVLTIYAYDLVGNRSETTLSLSVTPNNNVLEAFAATPLLFSPNADAVLDISQVKIMLKREARVTLRALNSQGVALATLIDSQLAPAGLLRFDWSGRSGTTALNDGFYSLELSVRGTALGDEPELDTLTVEIDNTAPVIAMIRPSAALVQGTGYLRASFDDLHFEQADAELIPPGANVSTLRNGNLRLAGELDLFELDPLGEGEASVRIQARDLAGNRSLLEKAFSIDRTPPEAVISAPLSNAVLGSVIAPIVMRGTARDAHFKSRELSLVSAANGSITVLNVAATPVNNAELDRFTPSVADGRYTLKLKVEDLVELSSTASVPVEIDNTPPVVVIASPANLAVVGRRLRVVGTVNDAHLTRYTIAIASASDAAAGLWSELGQGTTPQAKVELIDTELNQADGVYKLRLRASDVLNQTSETIVQIRLDAQPPATPLNLTANSPNQTDVIARWNAVADQDLAGYALYRDGIRLNQQLLTSTEYRDLNAPEATLHYQVSAIDAGGNESVRSNIAEVSLDRTPPQVLISVPANGERVRSVIQVIGTAYTDQGDFKDYHLFLTQLAPAAAPITLTRSPLAVQGGVLGQFDSSQFAAETRLRVSLEAQDTHNNSASTSVEVIVDNLSPPPVLSVTAQSSCAGATQVRWPALVVSDLLGYILYRDGTLVNGGAGAAQDMRPFAITSNAYDDESPGDGSHTYRLYSIDLAGNLSADSATAASSRDCGPPDLRLVEPAQDQQFETTLAILGESDDRDIVRVEYAYKPLASNTWTAIPPAITSAPFASVWTPDHAQLAYGSYEIRGVAFDASGISDPTPPVVRVQYVDRTAPNAPAPLTAVANEDTVQLNWGAVNASDLAGYRLNYISPELNTAELPLDGPTTALNFSHAPLSDGPQRYRVRALDTSANASPASAEATAYVYTPTFTQPFAPTQALSLNLAGESPRPGQIKLLLDGAQVQLSTSNSAGAFNFSNTSLPRGLHTFEVKATDSAGNQSRRTAIKIARDSKPAVPTGLVSTVVDHLIRLRWNGNGEDNILGYRLFQNNSPVLLDRNAPVAAARDQDGLAVPQAIDNNLTTNWAVPYGEGGFNGANYLELELAAPAILTRARIRWHSETTRAVSYKIMARFVDDIYMEVANVLDNSDTDNEVNFNVPYRTDRIRIVPVLPTFASDDLRLSEVALFERPLLSATSLDRTVLDGRYEFQLSAVNAYAFESDRSPVLRVDIGDVIAPPAVVLSGTLSGSDITLTWTPAKAPDIAFYDLYRNGLKIARVAHPGLNYLDARLRNGSYRYFVKALDSFENASAASNEVAFTVAVTSLSKPENLRVVPVVGGRALDVSWTPGPGPLPSFYRLRRSLNQLGPFTLIASPSALNLRDIGLSNGTRYWYTVEALDVAGNQSGQTDPVSGVPLDSAATVSLALTAPTLPSRPIVVRPAITSVAGFASGGSSARIFRNGVALPAAAITNQAITRAYNRFDAGTNAIIAPPMGSLVVISGPSSNTLWDLASDDRIRLNPGFAAFSPDALDLYIGQPAAANETTVKKYNTLSRQDVLVDLGVNTLQFVIPIANPVGSPASALGSEKLFVGGQRLLGGNQTDGLWLVEPADLSATVALGNQASAGLVTATARVAANGKIASVTRLDGHLLVVDLATRLVRDIASDVSTDSTDASAIHPDGSVVLYTKLVAGRKQIMRYTTATQSTAVWLSDPAAEYSEAKFDAAGIQVLLRKTDASGLNIESRVWPSANVTSAQIWFYAFAWAGTSEWVLNDGYDAYRVKPPGWFGLDSVSLVPGENLFSATALDAAGNASLPSAPISVTLLAPLTLKPDLTTSTGDLRFIPPSGLVGTDFSAIVTVRNLGAAASTASSLSAQLRKPNGSTQNLAIRSIAPLAPGAQLSLSVPLGVQNLAGLVDLSVAIDAANTLDESNEANNTASAELPITVDGRPTVSVLPDQLVFAPGTEPTAALRVLNPASRFAGKIKVRVEDATGALVLELPDVVVPSLNFGQVFNGRIRWPNVSAFADNYRFNAQLIDTQGDFVSRDIAGFAISAVRNINLSLSTDRASYSRSATARITAPLGFSSGNSPLESAQLNIVVRNTAGVEVARAERSLGTLLPGYQGQSVLNLALSGYASGVYTASADLVASGFSTGAQRSFLVLDEVLPAQLASGEISLSINPLGITLPGNAEAVVTNIGSGAIAPMQARLSLVSAPALTQIRQELGTLTLNPGANLRLPMNLGALNLALGNYVLILQGQYPGDATWRALSRRSLTVTDLIPPEITTLAPDSTGTPMRLPANLNARVLDRHSAVASVEHQIDAGAFLPVARDVDGSYSAQLTALTDGVHSVIWRARDSYGNQSQSPPQNFVIDTTPPVIVITGVSEGQISSVALNPAYLVTDNDLAISAATLNGAPFTTLSAVNLDNAYTLFVYGQDRAGNRAERALHFIIERVPPELSFVQPLNSEVIDAANTPAILRTEPFASVTLTQAGFSATAVADAFGTANIANVPLVFGANTLSARATDRAGNQSAIVSVTVTRPQIGLPLTGTLIASGNQIALGLPVSLNFAVTNAASTVLTALPLRLRVYANSNPVAIASREFSRDIAANASTSGVENFSASLFTLGSYSASLEANVAGTWTLLADAGFRIIDPNPPTLSVQIPSANQILGATARFKVSASDAESGLDKVEYRVDSGAWIDLGIGIAGQFESGDLAAISEAAHQFQARASDRAGNVALGVSTAFTMDRTPPAIAIANVAANGLYNINVTPVISISDAHSFTSTQTLNGQTYVSATPVINDGNYTLNVSATDVVGNTNSVSLSFAIDKTPPLVNFTYPANGAVLALDFTRVDGQTEALANVRLTLAGVTYLTVADAAGNFSVPSVPLLEGNNLISARATDRAGNTGPDASLSVIYRLNAGASLSGSLSAYGAPIALGQPVNAAYQLRNSGALVIRNLPVRIEFQRAGSSVVIETQSFTLTELLAGALNDGTRAFPSIGQPPGAYLMVLAAQLPDASGSKPTWVVLDTQSLNLADVLPPLATILAPPSDSYQRGEFATTVRATDLSSAITRVEARLSNNAWLDLITVAGQPNSYSGVVAHNVEEATQISARATDAAGNVSAIVTRPVLIDLNAPVISVPNIAEAALLNVAITPVISVQDFSPTQKTLTLNGGVYVEGTVISSDGDYVLRVSATDAVARTSIFERRFKLDRTAPTITITYPPKGLSTQLGQIRVSGLTESLAAVTLRNATLNIPVPADAQGGFSVAEMPLTIGENVITAQARDLAGNLSNTASVSVTRVGVNGQGLDGLIDALPPETTHGVALAARATLINIGTVDLSGTPMRWVARALQGGTQLAEQPFALSLAAGRPQMVDTSFASTTWPLGQVEISLETQLSSAGRAGVSWRILDRKQTLLLDRDPPVISWITPLVNAYVVPGELLSTQAIDLLSGIARVEVKLDEGKWQLMSPIAATPPNRFALNMPDASPGSHTLSARAVDVAGNVSVIVSQPIRVREVLALSIDTPLENAQLNVASTNVTGATKPSATVTLTIAAASYSASADKNGRYSFNGIALANGTNTLRAIANDSDGNSSLPVLRTVQVVIALPPQSLPVPLNPLSYWLMLGLILLLGMAAARKDAV